MDITALENKWLLIMLQPPAKDYTSVRIAKECIPELSLAMNREGNRCLILRLSKPFRASFMEETREYISILYFDESNHIVVRLQEPRFNEVFNSFIISVFHRIKDLAPIDTAAGELLKVYHEWSEFFAESSSQQLSFNDIMGMTGEIFVLNRFIRERPASEINDVLSAWTGPYDRGHDFTFDVGDTEVKTKLLSSPQVRISGEFQLEAAFGKELTLLVVSVLTEGEGTKTLSEYILETRDLIIERLGQVNIFLKAIGRKGLTQMNAAVYDQHRFKIKRTISYNCCADGFPKLVRSNIPPETRDLKYSLVTDTLTRYSTEQKDY